MFNIGDKAVYAAHGVGEIKRIETRKIGGINQDFYVLQILSSGSTLMVPAHACERHGMRPIATELQVANVYHILRSPSAVTHTTWNRRFREFMDKLASNDLADLAEVLRDVNALRRDKDLSYGEKKMMDKAISMLTAEISAATGAAPADAEAKLIDVLSEVVP